MAANITTQRVDYSSPKDRDALTALLDHYACDPMGGGSALAPKDLARLCDDLAGRPFAFSFIAWCEHLGNIQAIGLVNCFEAYSTFKARPLINIHDLIVHRDWRGQGVGQLLMYAVQQEALARAACKITLEVLSGNRIAMKSYERFGFTPYALDPKAGTASLMQKWL